MATKPKFTFKLEPKITGLASVGHCFQNSAIKFDKKVVGLISAPNWRRQGYTAAFTVKKTAEEFAESPNCEWKWIFFKKKTDTLEEIKEWLNASIETILAKYTLHEIES